MGNLFRREKGSSTGESTDTKNWTTDNRSEPGETLQQLTYSVSDPTMMPYLVMGYFALFIIIGDTFVDEIKE